MNIYQRLEWRTKMCDIADNMTKYDLTEEEFRICLDMAAIAMFSNGESSNNPKSIFAVAQPGAR